MKVAVFGAAGYIGDSVCEYLARFGSQVVGVDNLMYTDHYTRPMKFYNGDIRDVDLLEKIRVENPDIDAVVHLAAIVGDGACNVDTALTLSVNVTGTQNIAKVFGDKRLIFTSTCSVYGENDGLLNEESPTKPLSLYASSKLEAESYIDCLPDSVVFRLGTLFGISTQHGRVRNDLVCNVFSLRGFEGKKITVFGDAQWRPMVHVRDVGRILAHTALASFKGKYILAERNYTLGILASIVAHKTGCEVERTQIKGSDMRNYMVDTSKLLALQISPTITVENGITEMLNYFASGRIKNPWAPAYHNADAVKRMFDETSCS